MSFICWMNASALSRAHNQLVPWSGACPRVLAKEWDINRITDSTFDRPSYLSALRCFSEHLADIRYTCIRLACRRFNIQSLVLKRVWWFAHGDILKDMATCMSADMLAFGFQVLLFSVAQIAFSEQLRKSQKFLNMPDTNKNPNSSFPTI